VDLVRFLTALPGAPTTQPHGLPAQPDFVATDRGNFGTMVDAVNVTVFNHGAEPSDVDVRLECWWSP
jgi:hypothetical protein